MTDDTTRRDRLLDIEWWTAALGHRNGSDRGMAEFVVATLAADPSLFDDGALRAALERLAYRAGVVARIDRSGDPIAPSADAWHALDDALEEARAALAASPAPAGLDVERLARVLTALDPDTGQDDWQLIHVSQGDDYAKSRHEWAHAIARVYASDSERPA